MLVYATDAYLQACSEMHDAADDIGRCLSAQMGGKDAVKLDKQFQAGGYELALYKLSSSVRIRLEAMRSCSGESRS